MKRIALALIALCLAAIAPQSLAVVAEEGCTYHRSTLINSVANGTVRTDEINYRRTGSSSVDLSRTEDYSVTITLEHSFYDIPACVSWDVELRLPEGVHHGSDASTTGDSVHASGSNVAKRTALGSTDVATFPLHIETLHKEPGSTAHVYLRGQGYSHVGWYVVTVYGSDKAQPLTLNDVTDAQGRIYFPLHIRIANN